MRDHAQAALTATRPWGCWTVLGEGEGYKVKRIEVNPGQRLSLQRHAHRSEHWIVVAGTAKVSIGEQASFIHVQESTFVPVGTDHRIENPGSHLLIIIEIQNGTYLGEDDIVRFQDDYGRTDQ
jgi:mannose-6-phosphate isomerase